MRKLILAITCLLPVLANAQEGYTISGKITGITSSSTAYLERIVGNSWTTVDSAAVKNGAFEFKGILREPEQVIVRLKRLTTPQNPRNQGDNILFFLENSKISIIGADSIRTAKITGSNAERENEEMNAAAKPITDKMRLINRRFSPHNPNSANETPEARHMAQDSMLAYRDRLKAVEQAFVDKYSNTYWGLWAFRQYIMASKFDPAVIEPLFRKFPPELQSTGLGKSVSESIALAKRSQAGSKVLDFTQPDVNGKPFALSSLRGKYVFVDFWASWCIPCRAEMPAVRKAYAALKNKNFEILGVSLDADRSSWLSAIKKDQMTWIQVSDLKYWKNEAALLYDVHEIPQNFLVDPNGNVIAKDLHGNDLTEKLSALIK